MTKAHATLSKALFLIVTVVAAATAAEAVVWPGSGACAGTLQACIDAAAAGETVQVGTNTPVNESLTVAKTLTLEPVLGGAPTLVGEVNLRSAVTSAAISLHGFVINGQVVAVVGVGDLSVHVFDNRITSSVEDRAAVELGSNGQLSSSSGNLTAEIRDNEVFANGSGAGDFCVGIKLLAQTAPETLASITDNSVFAGACDQGGGIVVGNGDGVAVNVDILRNDVLVPGSAFGLVLENANLGPDSALISRVIDNLITGDGNFSGANIVDAADGVLNVQFVNNTIVGHHVGVMLFANTGQPMTGTVANNIIAGNSTEGLRIDAEGVTNRHNLLFGNGPDTFTPGPGTVTADPLFVGGGNYHLQPTSPAIDAGDSDALQSDITTDLLGAPRIQGAAIDIGAIEGAEGVPLAVVPTLSDAALVLLAALLIAGGLVILRRS